MITVKQVKATVKRIKKEKPIYEDALLEQVNLFQAVLETIASDAFSRGPYASAHIYDRQLLATEALKVRK